MMSSIDGRLIFDRWSAPAAGIDAGRLRRHYEEVAMHFRADGWIVGRKTMEEFAHGVAQPSRKIEGDLPSTFIADRNGRNIAVAIDPHGKLHYGKDNIDGDHFVAVVGEQVSEQYLAELRADGVSYLFAGPKGDDLQQAMNILGDAFAIETILLEGGGLINGAFLREQLIDEISLLIYPGIDALAGVPSIFEFLGDPEERPAAGQSLRHLGTETLDGGVVWLRYGLEKGPRSLPRRGA